MADDTMHDDELEIAWTLLANVSGGDWTQQSSEWQEGAARWRDRVMPGLSARLADLARAPHPEETNANG